MKKKYKIIWICQVYNELERENIKRFFTYNSEYVDDFVVYDDCSTDGTYEFCLTQTPYVIRGKKNTFTAEMSHKQILLKKALELQADFIVLLDADEVLTKISREQLESICQDCENRWIDGLSLKKINLWRSDTWKRTDSLFDDGWFVQIWRVTDGIGYHEIRDGLHQPAHPTTMKHIEKCYSVAVLHYGFANMLNIAYKYLTYKWHGQEGYIMLDRLVNEDRLTVEKVDANLFPKGLENPDEPEVIKHSLLENMNSIQSFKSQVVRPKYSIVCLIYKSVDWLEFVYNQVLKYTDLSDKEFFFVANDPTDEVVSYLENNYIPHFIYRNSHTQKDEWHINNVYRAYNYWVEVAKGDFVIMINSDMAFSPNWVEALISAYDGSSCVASRLVESWKLRSGTYGIEKDFWLTYSEYQEDSFQNYASTIKEPIVKDSGLYMPLFIRKADFLKIWGYPEGNMRSDSTDIFNPIIAKKGDDLISGDRILMKRLDSIGIQHKTAFDSVVYHFQSGELDEKITLSADRKRERIAICNDITTGTMGEKVLWDFFLERLPWAYSLDKRTVWAGWDYEYKAREYIKNNVPETSLIIQNATFIWTISDEIHTICFLQDDLRWMGRKNAQQELNLKLADKIATNTVLTSLSYRDFPCEIIPVGLDTDLFKPGNKTELRKKYGLPEQKKIGIFVGSFSEVKGWSKVQSCFQTYSDYHWIAISKYEESFVAPNVTVFNRLHQDVLAELLSSADFFIIGSPVETQCLAALEALLCWIPVVMPFTWIFTDFSQADRDNLWVFGNDLVVWVAELMKRDYPHTRKIIIDKWLGLDHSMMIWRTFLERFFLEKRLWKIPRSILKSEGKFSWFQVEFYLRKYFLRFVGLEYFNFKKITTVSGFRMMVYEFLATHNLLPIVKKLLWEKLRKKLGFKS